MFHEKTSVTLYDFDKAVDDYKNGSDEALRKIIMSGEEAIAACLSVLEIKEDNLIAILRGKPIHKKDLKKVNKITGEHLAVFCGDQFVEVARIVNKDDVFAVPEFVFN
jgi:hypothetical protein